MLVTKAGNFIVDGRKYNAIRNGARYGPAYQEEANDPHTLLLIHGNEIADASMYDVPLVNNGAAVSMEQSKFGNGSLYFDGNSNLQATKNYFITGTEDFTIEWWEYLPQSVSGGCSFSLCSVPEFLVYYTEQDLQAWISPSYAGDVIAQQILGQWTHRALVRNINTLMFFANGTKTFQGEYTSAVPETQNYGCFVGGRVNNTQPFYGYIEEFRISDIARWNSDFTPPTAPYES